MRRLRFRRLLDPFDIELADEALELGATGATNFDPREEDADGALAFFATFGAFIELVPTMATGTLTGTITGTAMGTGTGTATGTDDPDAAGAVVCATTLTSRLARRNRTIFAGFMMIFFEDFFL